MFRTSSLIAVLAVAVPVAAQVPTKCLEIERILVDACISSTACPGSQEGQNEMVLFRVGPQPIALGDLTVDWPNNGFQGLVQNGTTASVTATLNASVTACGLLLEPPNGVMPAGAPVLLISSTDMCTQANSFAGLTDTLYVIFQQAGNTQGHFANQNNGSLISPIPTGGVSLRSLVITRNSTACSDTVTYDRQGLVNVYGTYGGNSAENDGATVSFVWPGAPVAAYSNPGCQAPVVTTTVVASAAAPSLCAGGTVALSGSIAGSYASVLWSGGTGTFSAPTDTVTTYTAGAGDQGSVVLSFCAVGTCGQSTCDTVLLSIDPAPAVGITTTGPAELCPGGSLVLLATGGSGYLWSTGDTTAQITVTATGPYAVTGFNACGQSTASITVQAGPTPVVSIAGGGTLCTGSSMMLTASGADTYVWSNGDTNASILVTSSGSFTVVGTNACGQDSATVVVSPPQPLVVTVSGDTVLCPGETTVLTASPGVTYQWSNGQTTQSISVGTPGSYFVAVSNGCTSGTALALVTGVSLNAAFTATPVSGTAPLLVSFTNGSAPATGVSSWSFGDGGFSAAASPAYTFSDPGTYTVALTYTVSGCTDEATFSIAVSAGPMGEPSVFVPNVFSPNGDGMNDQLHVVTDRIVSLSLSIFNRWGQEVAVLKNVDERWDGRTGSGTAVADGTYFYVLQATADDGSVFERNGSITVLR